MSRERGRRRPDGDRAWTDYTEHFRRDVVPRLLSSASIIQIGEGVPDEITSDVIQAGTELGVMLLLDKPLILLVPIGTTVPAALRRAATEVVEDVDMDDPATQDRIAAVVRRLGGLP